MLIWVFYSECICVCFKTKTLCWIFKNPTEGLFVFCCILVEGASFNALELMVIHYRLILLQLLLRWENLQVQG